MTLSTGKDTVCPLCTKTGKGSVRRESNQAEAAVTAQPAVLLGPHSAECLWQTPLLPSSEISVTIYSTSGQENLTPGSECCSQGESQTPQCATSPHREAGPGWWKRAASPHPTRWQHAAHRAGMGTLPPSSWGHGQQAAQPSRSGSAPVLVYHTCLPDHTVGQRPTKPETKHCNRTEVSCHVAQAQLCHTDEESLSSSLFFSFCCRSRQTLHANRQTKVMANLSMHPRTWIISLPEAHSLIRTDNKDSVNFVSSWIPMKTRPTLKPSNNNFLFGVGLFSEAQTPHSGSACSLGAVVQPAQCSPSHTGLCAAVARRVCRNAFSRAARTEETNKLTDYTRHLNWQKSPAGVVWVAQFSRNGRRQGKDWYNLILGQ